MRACEGGDHVLDNGRAPTAPPDSAAGGGTTAPNQLGVDEEGQEAGADSDTAYPEADPTGAPSPSYWI